MKLYFYDTIDYNHEKTLDVRWRRPIFFARAQPAAISPDGKTFALGTQASEDHGTVKLVDLVTGDEISELSHGRKSLFEKHAEHVTYVSFSPDGRFLISSTYTNTGVWLKSEAAK